MDPEFSWREVEESGDKYLAFPTGFKYWVEFRNVRYWDFCFSYSSLMIYQIGSRWECLQMMSRSGAPSGQIVADNNSLQEDLNSLSSWFSKWLLKINSSKCKVMHIGHSPWSDYHITDDAGNSIAIEQITEEKDAHTEDLKPGTHYAVC